VLGLVINYKIKEMNLYKKVEIKKTVDKIEELTNLLESEIVKFKGMIKAYEKEIELAKDDEVLINLNKRMVEISDKIDGLTN